MEAHARSRRAVPGDELGGELNGLADKAQARCGRRERDHRGDGVRLERQPTDAAGVRTATR